MLIVSKVVFKMNMVIVRIVQVALGRYRSVVSIGKSALVLFYHIISYVQYESRL